MRTTIDLDAPVLERLKVLQKREGKSLGRLVSDLLLQAMATNPGASGAQPAPFRWVVRPMGALVDVADREAVYDRMDADFR